MLNRYFPTALCLLFLGGCGSESAPGAVPVDSVANEVSPPAGESRFGTTVGSIVSVNPELREITLDHGPFSGIEMGAMTMGFDVAPGVDLTGVTADARVAVRVRQNPNFSFEVVALCATAADSVDCLGTTPDPG